MANLYDRRRHHHLLHHKTTIFLPMFCRLSLKDINLSRRSRRDPSLSDEPTSPKVSCMGQVKRNNRVTGLPSTAAAAASTPTGTQHHKYSKLRKLFSSKTLLPPLTASLPTTTPASAAVGGGGRSRSKSCRSSKEVCVDNLRRLKLKKDCEGDYIKVVDVSELDPPLPVLKKAASQGVAGDGANLWKRRFNGAAQIGKIHLPTCKIPQPPTV